MFWHSDLCAQLEQQLLSYLPLSLASDLVKVIPFSYISFLVFADIFDISIVSFTNLECLALILMVS